MTDPRVSESAEFERLLRERYAPLLTDDQLRRLRRKCGLGDVMDGEVVHRGCGVELAIVAAEQIAAYRPEVADGADLLVIVPTRSRPHAVERVAAAWYATGAFDDGAALVFAVDDDDPTYPEYLAALHRLAALDPGPTPINMMNTGRWRPMVPKLNWAAGTFAARDHFALGFAGDDHLPRSAGWARRYLDALRELGTGIVYGNDLLQGERLPTQWAMTADIVRALGGRMVPALVEHLYCDNAVKALGLRADCLRYLPSVVVEHLHPIALKAPTDAQYRRVNAPERYREDGAAYRRWIREELAFDAAAVRALKHQPIPQEA